MLNNMAKKSNGTGTIRQRANGTWEGLYYLKGKRKSIYGKTETDVRIRLNKIIAEILEGEHIEQSKDTLGDWLVKWREEFAYPVIKTATYDTYGDYINKHFLPHDISKCPLKSLKCDTLQRFFNQKYENGRLDGKGGLSPKYLKNIRNMLNCALEQAVENELIKKNPLVYVKLPKQKKPDMRFLSATEQVELSKVVYTFGEMQALGIIIALGTGVRLGELLGLRIPLINLKENTIRIEKTLARRKRPESGVLKDALIIDTGMAADSKTVIVLGDVKTESGKRIVAMTSAVREAVERLIDLNSAYKKQFGKSFNKHNFLLFNEMGNPLDPRTYEDVFYRYVERAGIAKANFHSLRHTFAMNIIEKGGDLKTLAALLGHSDEQTSLIYLHTHDKKKKATIGLLEQDNDPRKEKPSENQNKANENVTVVIDKEAMKLFLEHAVKYNLDCTEPSEFVKKNLSLLKVV
jgi:integrase